MFFGFASLEKDFVIGLTKLDFGDSSLYGLWIGYYGLVIGFQHADT